MPRLGKLADVLVSYILGKVFYDPHSYWERRAAVYKTYRPKFHEQHKTAAMKLLVGSVLEVGCGTGRLLSIHKGLGVDFSLNMLKQCEGERIAMDAAFLGFIDKSFDTVFTCETLMHIKPDQIERVVSQILRIARKRIVAIEYDGNLPILAKHLFKHDYRKFFPGAKICDLLPSAKAYKLGRESVFVYDLEGTDSIAANMAVQRG